jgi:hypothetical protein
MDGTFPVIHDYFFAAVKQSCARLGSEMLLQTGAAGDRGNRVKACNPVFPLAPTDQLTCSEASFYHYYLLQLGLHPVAVVLP